MYRVKMECGNCGHKGYAEIINGQAFCERCLETDTVIGIKKGDSSSEQDITKGYDKDNYTTKAL